MAALLNAFVLLFITFLCGAPISYGDELVLSEALKASEPKRVIDHGVYGPLFTIEEEDMIEVLKRRLLHLKESGKLEQAEKAFKEKAQKRILEPMKVAHITPTTHTRVFSVDPTLVVAGDIALPEGIANGGHVLAKKGDRINPLHHVKPSKGLLFIDGENTAHVDYARTVLDAFDIVLVNGKPLALEATLGVPVFFDQGGIITKRYGIMHVPARMEVEGDTLKFTEFTLA